MERERDFLDDAEADPQRLFDTDASGVVDLRSGENHPFTMNRALLFLRPRTSNWQDKFQECSGNHHDMDRWLLYDEDTIIAAKSSVERVLRSSGTQAEILAEGIVLLQIP